MILLWIILVGWAHPAEAQVLELEGSYQPKDEQAHAVMLARPTEIASGQQCLSPDPEDEYLISSFGGLWRVVLEGCAFIVAWDTFKKCWRRKSRNQTAVIIQTEEDGIVPMPLEDGVPNRVLILYSLWEAGYRIDWEPYPEDVREEFFGMTGSYLRQLSDASS